MIYRDLVEFEVDVEFHSVQSMLNHRKIRHLYNCVWSDADLGIYSLWIDGISTVHDCCGFVMFCNDPMEVILHSEDHANGPLVRRIYHRPGLVNVDRVKLLLSEVEELYCETGKEIRTRYDLVDPWRIDEITYAGLLD